MRVLVTGSRAWTDSTTIRDALAEIDRDEPGPHTLVHGAARGADTIAARWASRLGWTIEAHPVTNVEWRASRAAGYRRNQAMVAIGADVVLAFIHANSRGASHCAAIAARAGLSVRYFRRSS